jgi:hypothetical protein
MAKNAILLTSIWLPSANADSTDSVTMLVLLKFIMNVASTTQPDTGMTCIISSEMIVASKIPARILLVILKIITDQMVIVVYTGMRRCTAKGVTAL